MAAVELLGGAVALALRFIGYVLADVLFDLLVRGLGHRVLRILMPRREHGEAAAAVVGLLAWAIVAGGVLWIYRSAA